MKTSTINLAIPDQLLRQADEVAKRESRSRSELMREALRAYLGRRVMPMPMSLDWGCGPRMWGRQSPNTEKASRGGDK
jgi:hypothetical protein